MVCDQCAVRRELAEGSFEQCGNASCPRCRSKGLVDFATDIALRSYMKRWEQAHPTK